MNTGRTIRVVDGLVAVGWRAWSVEETQDGIRLGSVIHDAIWDPGVAAVAGCAHSHRAPDASCNCGFHAARDPVDAFSYLLGRDGPRTLCRVLGEVVLADRLVETEAGWRASKAYPVRLYTADTELAEALAVYGVPVLSSEWTSASATSSTPASAGSSRSSCTAARMRSSSTAASG
jgi:hypothetical protein